MRIFNLQKQRKRLISGWMESTPKLGAYLLRGVGKTNSTLKERLLVYSEDNTDKLLVATKLNREPNDKSSLSDLFFSSVAKVVEVRGK